MSSQAWSEIILSIQDKNPYCRKLLFEIYHQEDEFRERRFYELCLALYGRFFYEKLNPIMLGQYFQSLNSIFDQHYLLAQNPEIQKILNLGLQLNNFTQYSEDNFQLTNILLQINYFITKWQNKNHICKFCGHKLNLLTESLDHGHKKKVDSNQKEISLY